MWKPKTKISRSIPRKIQSNILEKLSVGMRLLITVSPLVQEVLRRSRDPCTK